MLEGRAGPAGAEQRGDLVHPWQAAVTLPQAGSSGGVGEGSREMRVGTHTVEGSKGQERAALLGAWPYPSRARPLGVFVIWKGSSAGEIGHLMPKHCTRAVGLL